MKSIRDSKWVYIILSVIIAVSFWMFVRSGEDMETTVYNIPVTLNGERVLENQGLMITGVDSETVDLSWRGSWRALSQLDRGSVSVSLDVSRITEPGVFSLTYSITLPNTVSPSDLSLVHSSPERIEVTVARIYSETFDIEAVFQGSVADGYQAGSLTVSPETVQISGPEESVSKVASVQVVLEQYDVSESYNGELPLQLLDAQGGVIEDESLRLSAESAVVSMPVLVVKEVELTVELLPGGGATGEDAVCEVEPSTITVAGPEEAMQALDSISLGSIDLSQVVGTYIRDFQIYLDTGLENVSGVTTAQVTVTVDGLTTRAFEVDNIRMINEPSGYTPTLNTQVCTVVLRGPEEALDLIHESQIRIVADLADLSRATGTYSVPARVYVDGSSEVGVIGAYTVSVTITR